MRNQNNSNQNFLVNAAQTLYGAQRKKDEEEKSLRNSLLNQLGDKVEAKHILYSSNDELKKMRDEMNAKQSKNNFRGNFLRAANSIDESALNNLQAPLPGNGKETSPLNEVNKDVKEPEIDSTRKAKLLDKIPVERKTQQNSSLSKQEERDKNFQGLEYATGEETYDMQPIKAGIDFNIDKNELEAENNKNIDNNSNKQESLRQSKINDEQFNELMKHVYKTEGGFVDNPKDRGGRTNKGVTQRTFDAYNKKHGLPLKDVKDISYDESDKIYYEEYWKASGADKIKDKNLAYMHFDSAINHGVGRAKKFLEQSGGDFDKYYQARKTFYDDIVRGDKTQAEFYQGWMNRINRIDKMRYQN